MNNAVVDKVAALYQIRQQISAMEKIEKVMSGEMKELLDQDLEDNNNEVAVGKLIVKRIASSRTSISSEKLLERGVSPGIVQYATTVSQYFQYKIKEKGNKDA